jgi:aarF domain-containing kinase
MGDLVFFLHWSECVTLFGSNISAPFNVKNVQLTFVCPFSRAALYTTHAAKQDAVWHAHAAFQAELHDLRNQIPLIVRSIWGRHTETAVNALRQPGARRLIESWKDAEQRLIAVANSLTTLHAGQKIVAIGVPLAAAHLIGGSAASRCYTAPSALNGKDRRRYVAGAQFSMHRLREILDRTMEWMQHEMALARRGAFLFLLFLPLAFSSPLCLLGDAHRSRWFELLLWTLERAGPAFIKWGQWAATRPDLFPQNFCTTISKLQTGAPSHRFCDTRKIVESAFGRPLESLFAEFQETPVASGSIAQVHKAVLSSEGARLAGGAVARTGLLPLPGRGRARRQRATFIEGAPVAVKVRHPGVTDIIERDFALMQRVAAVLGAVACGPQLSESLMQFGAPMREQLDLVAEADHLSKFADNFKWWSGVRFPLPAAEPLVASDVLVESFEEGDHISTFLERSSKHNKVLAGLGIGCYLKMLLQDNYIHADMHPGNILVRVEGPPPGSFTARAAAALGREAPKLPRLVLLDVGMTAKLTQDDQRNLVGFFKGLTELDGAAVADAILRFAEQPHDAPPKASNTNNKSTTTPATMPQASQQQGSTKDAGAVLGDWARNAMKRVYSDTEQADDSAAVIAGFRADMASLFSRLDPEMLRQNTSEVMAEMMDTIRRHGVHIRGVVSTVVITSIVLEGWSSKLDPDVRVLETVKSKLEMLPSAWAERCSAAVEKVLCSTVLTVM